ncbi:hypothetical protein GCM10017566_62440 [Amycolatopsis bartoniae]|uniref:Uncharacterized protein n=1 Tax=Amycolatopsis bartoniae TaxID=941986 RepID=A0A8H9J1M4_9PSEU|nr:hypothetical protein GCM10017566_62440 [Amycolatopsis bartoniae]
MSAASSATLRWALLSALAFALIGMHSLVAPGSAPAQAMTMVSASPEVSGPAMAIPVAEPACCLDHLVDSGSGHSPGHSHDPLHLCLAVLVALAGLAIAWLLWQHSQNTTRHHTPSAAVTSAGRGPPRARPTSCLLLSLCVLRL